MTRYTNKAFSVGVVIPHLRRFFEGYEVPEGLPSAPYAWCGYQAVDLVFQWMRNRLAARTVRGSDKIEIFFQHGDEDKGELIRAVKARHNGYEPSFSGTAAAVPYQACDWLAWEHRNFLSVRTRRPGAVPSYANVQLARRIAFDSSIYADWSTLVRGAKERGWPKRENT